MVKRLFQIKTLKSVIIKNVFEVIKPYIKEANLVIDSEGIKLTTMDISKSSLTHIKLEADKFESFFCEKKHIIGIDTTIFFKTIKSVNRRETITFYMNENEEDKLGIELSDTFSGKIKDYKLPILALDNKLISIPDMTFDYVINIPTNQFQQIIKDIHLLEGKVIEIKSLDKQLIFSCDDGLAEFKTTINEIDDETSKYQQEIFQNEDVKSIKFKKTGNIIVQGKYKMTYLMNFIKASHLCDNMNILMKNDKPLILEYFIADLGKLLFLLIQHNE